MGAALIYFSRIALVPLAIGLGIVAYALAVAFYTLLASGACAGFAARIAALRRAGHSGQQRSERHSRFLRLRNSDFPVNNRAMYSPNLEEFLKLAAQGNLIPVTRRLLADFETPLSAYRKIRGAGRIVSVRVRRRRRTSRPLFLRRLQSARLIRQTGNRVEVIENGKVVETFYRRSKRRDIRSAASVARPRVTSGSRRRPIVRDGLEVVERVMKKYRAVPLPGLPRFTGGAVGFIGYEFIHDVEPVVPRPPQDDLNTPVMYFLIADELLIFDRVAQTITILVNAVLEDARQPGGSLRKCHRRKSSGSFRCWNNPANIAR